MADVAREASSRGDIVSVLARDRTLTGMVIHVGRDYLSLETPTEWVDVRLTSAMLSIVRRPAGGIAARGGSVTFKARLSEYEQTGEPVTLLTSVAPVPVEGRVEVVASDHVVVRHREGGESIAPLASIDLILRPRPPRPGR